MEMYLQDEFTVIKPIITVIDHDDSVFSRGLVDYLGENASFKEISEEEIKDELFFAEIAAAIIIDEGFADKMRSGEAEVTIIKSPSRVSAINIELLINKYLNLAQPYFDMGVAEKEIVEFLQTDVTEEVIINFVTDEEEVSDLESTAVYFNFIAFGLLAAILGSVSFIMKNYNETNIKMRSMCAPISNRKYNWQIIIGNVCVAFMLWLIFIFLGWYFHQDALFTSSGLLMIISAFLFSQVALAIAYVIGVFVKSSEVQNGLAIVIPLAMAFLGGAFIPQSLLGEAVLSLSRITPTYWYVRVIDLLSEPGLSNNVMTAFYQTSFILIAFTIIIYGGALLVKNKYTKYIN